MLNIFCDEYPKYVNEFVHRACEYLDITKYKCDLMVHREKSLGNNINGLCYGDKVCIDVEYALTVENKRLDRREILITIAHELVHAKQYLTNELIIKKTNKRNYRTFWKGEYIPGEVDEESQPWEIEAYNLEEEIYNAVIGVESDE